MNTRNTPKGEGAWAPDHWFCQNWGECRLMPQMFEIPGFRSCLRSQINHFVLALHCTYAATGRLPVDHHSTPTPPFCFPPFVKISPGLWESSTLVPPTPWPQEVFMPLLTHFGIKAPPGCGRIDSWALGTKRHPFLCRLDFVAVVVAAAASNPPQQAHTPIPYLSLCAS